MAIDSQQKLVWHKPKGFDGYRWELHNQLTNEMLGSVEKLVRTRGANGALYRAVFHGSGRARHVDRSSMKAAKQWVMSMVIERELASAS